MGRICGIDLGTTNSIIAIINAEGKPEVVVNADGGRLTPSAVCIHDGQASVGANAKKQFQKYPGDTVLSVKRFMGTRQKFSMGGQGETPQQTLTPEQISAMILKKLVLDASKNIGDEITDAVITVPAYFDDLQRTATKQAGEIAGLNVLRIINEPTSAALAYGLDQRNERTVCVYDLGGGTFDVSILIVGDGLCEVKSTSGDTHLGGDDFDRELRSYAVARFKEETGINLVDDEVAMARLLAASEETKIALSGSDITTLSVPYIAQGPDGPLHIEYQITRDHFELLISKYIDRTIECVRRAIEDASMTNDDIAEVLLVGGSTRVPAVHKAIRDLFGRTPNTSLNPDEVVAIGAAINAGIIAGIVDNVILTDVTPLTLAIETKGGVATSMIRRNTTIPTSMTAIFSTADDNQDEVVIHITQGERQLTADNRSLGKFKLGGILPAPAGAPKIEVTFDIDVNGILSVSAKDLLTEKANSVTITESGSLEDFEVNRMIEDAKANEETDLAKRKLIEAKNFSELLVKHATTLLLDNYDRVTDEKVLVELDEAIETLRKNLSGVDNPNVLNQSAEALKEAMKKFGGLLYEQAEIRRARGEG
jgi:molecular chaperone DnaK